MYNIKFINNEGKVSTENTTHLASGTHLIGYVGESYKNLVDVFGKPKDVSKSSVKCDAEWVLMTPEGLVTIYNYKNGKNYLGNEGPNIEDVDEWNIGGYDESSTKYIYRALDIIGDEKVETLI